MEYEICQCCYMAVGNGDTSGCDYWGCTHQPASNLPYVVPLGTEPTQYRVTFVCDGCGDDILPMGDFYPVRVL